MSGSKKCAIYLRVSKTNGSQSVDNQRPEVEQLARARGFEVVHVYEEHASAAKHRPEHERLMKDAKRGAFDVLIVWALDRFGRSMVGNLADVLELDRIGVTVVSVRESWLDTGGPVRSLLIAILSWCAEQERLRLIERTKAGLATARRKGKRLGRPRAERRHRDQKGQRLDVDAAREMIATGASTRAAARRLGASEATLRRALARAPAISPTP
ncbi:MAG: recombinase family protein [Polyangiaceae bacterium]